MDRVLGQGVVPGAVVLLGGEPGIGKSTLMLQSVLHMAAHSQRILYVAGEESPEQVRMRAERLGAVSPSLYVFAETDAQAVLRELEANKPDAVIIDSIQTMFLPEVESAPGSVAQIRETAAAFTRFAKQHHVPVFFIGHITKEGSLAGPKSEHMVDVVLQFEGERHHAYRMLSGPKPFGTTARLGLYEMRGSGLKAVDHPSDALLGQRSEEDALSGTAVSAALKARVQCWWKCKHWCQRRCTGRRNARARIRSAPAEHAVGGLGKAMGSNWVEGRVPQFGGWLKIQDPAMIGGCCRHLEQRADVPLRGRCLPERWG